jgi:integrase/recombinase XerC
MDTGLVHRTSWHDVNYRRVDAVKACHERDVTRMLELLKTYLEYRGRKKGLTSMNTLAAYRYGLAAWVTFCWPDPNQAPSVPFLRATVDDVDLFIVWLQGRVAATTVQNYLQGVRAFYRALIWAKATEINPADETFAPSDPRPVEERRTMLAIDAYKGICDSLAVNDEPLAKRDLLIMRFFGDAGLRVSSLAALDVSDVRLSAREFLVRRAKGGKVATLPMSPQLIRAAERWLEVRGHHATSEEPALLTNFGGKVNVGYLGKRVGIKTLERTVDRLFQAAGIPDDVYGPHSVRHTAGTRYYALFKDIYKVAKLMMHSDIKTTTIYAKLAASQLKDEMAMLENF